MELNRKSSDLILCTFFLRKVSPRIEVKKSLNEKRTQPTIHHHRVHRVFRCICLCVCVCDMTQFLFQTAEEMHHLMSDRSQECITYTRASRLLLFAGRVFLTIFFFSFLLLLATPHSSHAHDMVYSFSEIFFDALETSKRYNTTRMIHRLNVVSVLFRESAVHFS